MLFEELDADEIILDLSVALGLKGKIPNFTNPVLMLGIEKARSKGSLTTQAKSFFDTNFVHERKS